MENLCIDEDRLRFAFSEGTGKMKDARPTNDQKYSNGGYNVLCVVCVRGLR